MNPARFEYFSPSTLEEAYELLDKYEDEAKVLSGGHSLIPAMKLRLAIPSAVVDLRRIPALDSIEEDGEGIRIGALVTHHAVETSDLVRKRCNLLRQTASEIGDIQVRNAGTLVGSICHADPAADYPASLLALEAKVVIGGSAGEKIFPFSEFLQGLFSTALEPNEIVRAVSIPKAFPPTASYRKIRQCASGFALAGAAVQLSLEEGVIRKAAVGITGVADCPFRARAVVEKLIGVSLQDGEAIEKAVRGITEGMEVLSDLHASSDYRAHLAEVVALRALLSAGAEK